MGRQVHVVYCLRGLRPVCSTLPSAGRVATAGSKPSLPATSALSIPGTLAAAAAIPAPGLWILVRRELAAVGVQVLNVCRLSRLQPMPLIAPPTTSALAVVFTFSTTCCCP